MLLLKHRLLRPSLLMHVGETWMVVVHMFWGTEGVHAVLFRVIMLCVLL